MADFFADNADLQFYMNHWIDWASLVDLTEYLGRAPDAYPSTAEAVASYKEVLTLIGEFAADRLAPASAAMDREGMGYADGEAVVPPTQTRIMKELNALELNGMCLPRELGGQNLPFTLLLMGTELLARGDVAIMSHFGFHGGIALAMLIYSIREGTTEFDVANARILKTRFQKQIDEIRRGKAWGSMDITEPDAGSDMARLRCTATQGPDGLWRLTGQKIFITSGHGKYHFVIARTEPNTGSPDDPMAGLNGLSFFLVPAFDESGKRIVSLDRLEEKLGHHPSATAALSYEDAVGELVGKRGEGFQYMLLLMNNARLTVGFESLGLMESALRMAKAYAAERKSMGKTIDRHELVAELIDDIETDIVGIRALAMYGAMCEELSQKIQILEAAGWSPDDPKVIAYKATLKKHKAEARRVTPLLKYLAAEKAVETARKGIQIHGGVGFTREYGAEKLLRDAMVFPIYEGTSQIQSLMAMKDTLGAIIKDPGGFVTKLAQAHWRSRSAKTELERRAAKLEAHCLEAQRLLVQRTVADKARSLQGTPMTAWPKAFAKNWNPKRDFAFAMLHAERLTRLLADSAIADLLVKQALRFPERATWAERWLEKAEPRARFLVDEIQSTGNRLLADLGSASPTAAAKAS